MSPPQPATVVPSAAPTSHAPKRPASVVSTRLQPPVRQSRLASKVGSNRIAIHAAPSRAVCLTAGAVGLTMVFLGFVAGLIRDGSLITAIGQGVFTPVLPTALAALIGWGNEHRARIAFSLIGAAVIPVVLLQILGSLAV